MYNPYGAGNVHVDKVLTNISLAWPNNEFVGERLFPVVKVSKQTDMYYWFGRDSWVPETSDYRAPGSVANEIPGVGVALDTYYASEHSLQIPVTDEERQNSDSPMSPDRDATEHVTQKILLGRELAMKNLVTNTANYATGLSVTLSGTDRWNDYTNSDPVDDIKVGKRAVHAKVYFEPNTAIIPYQVMSVLEDHPDIIERIKYTDRAILTKEIIAAVFQIPNIIVPGVAVGAGVGFAITSSYLWGKDVVLAYVPPRAGLRIPAFAYEFVWGFPETQQVDRWRETQRKSDLVRVSRRYDLKLVGVETDPASGDYKKSITGYLIKTAIA